MIELTHHDSGFGLPWTEQRIGVPRFMASWLAVQQASIMGLEETPTVDDEGERISIGPFSFETDEQLDTFRDLLERSADLFVLDLGRLFLRKYEGDELKKTMIEEEGF